MYYYDIYFSSQFLTILPSFNISILVFNFLPLFLPFSIFYFLFFIFFHFRVFDFHFRVFQSLRNRIEALESQLEAGWGAILEKPDRKNGVNSFEKDQNINKEEP